MWISKPSSHCSIITDILRISVRVIKARQNGTYLLFSGLPVVIPLKPTVRISSSVTANSFLWNPNIKKKKKKLPELPHE